MQVISLDQVKTQLGISDTSQDAAITAKLPIIDAKVKQICNSTFNYRFAADMSNGSNVLTAYALFKGRDNYPAGINNPVIVRDVSKSLEIGMLVEGDNIPADTYITNFYKTGSEDSFYSSIDTLYVELSENVTDDGAGVYVTGGISIAYHDTIAKGVQFLIDGTNTTLPDTGDWETKRMGPLTLSKGEGGSAIDGRYGMPTWFVKGMPPRYR